MAPQTRLFSDTRPNSPTPPEPLIEAVARDVPETLAGMENTTEYGAGPPMPGQRIVLHYRLVQALTQNKQYSKAAAEWAIHQLVTRRMLTIRPGCTSTPGVIGCDGAWTMAPISQEMRELQYCLVQSTPCLWTWWREQHEDPSAPSATRGICEAPTAPCETLAEELPRSLEQLRDWLAERVCWLRDWHLAPDPKPLAPGLQAVLAQMFRHTSRDFPNNRQDLSTWASQYIWMFSEIAAHQAHVSLNRLGILDALAWPSPDIENDMRALIVALDHLAALLSFVAQRCTQIESASPPTAASSAQAVQRISLAPATMPATATPSSREAAVKPSKSVSATSSSATKS